MSRDSNYTYIHTHASHHADLFEEFCHPPSTTTSSTSHANTHGTNNSTNPTTSDPGMIHVPGHFLPFEEIHLPPHLMPLNPEDEDDVVPDMHAAFGIQRALGQEGASGAAREPVWRDLGLERLLESGGVKGKEGASVSAAGVGGAGRREGSRTGILLMR